MYIQNPLRKKQKYYMPLHFVLKTIYISKCFLFFFLFLLSQEVTPCPVLQNPRCVCTDGSHRNIQTNKCLFGWCEAAGTSQSVCVLTFCQKETKLTLKITPSNSIEKRIQIII
ncbi:hypothetical protein ILYODFUR_004742 [Ilyodon furcidens]|uniref:Uncharacterized protein n=1 Tax=Ilyodon furcidens TaxID=33524 RepID=A0ABV0UDS5_9TELE